MGNDQIQRPDEGPLIELVSDYAALRLRSQLLAVVATQGEKEFQDWLQAACEVQAASARLKAWLLEQDTALMVQVWEAGVSLAASGSTA